MEIFIKLTFIFLLTPLLFFSCNPQEEIITDKKAISLTIDRDSLVFDTLFASRKSITKRLKIYNDQKKAIMIDRIGLDQGKQSSYKVYVNGIAGNQFGPLKLLGKDSMQVFVEVRVTPRDYDQPFLVKDHLFVKTSGGTREIPLLTWGQDVHYIDHLVIKQDSVFSGARPYVVREEIRVAQGGMLQINKGGRLYFSNDAKMVIQGTLLAEGTVEQPISFKNDRFGGDYEKAPGQWQGLIFEKSSNENFLNHVEIKNANTGILLQSQDEDTLPDLVLANARIANMAAAGIKAQKADLYAYNILVNNCVQYLLGNFGGGNYHFQHCTFVNTPTNFFREHPVMVLADNGYGLDDDTSIPMEFRMENAIIWGSLPDEIGIDSVENSLSRIKLRSNIMKTNNPEWEQENIVDKEPGFIAPGNREYGLKEDAPARDKGVETGITKDIRGVKRDSLPDIGAYEWTENSKKDQ